MNDRKDGFMGSGFSPDIARSSLPDDPAIATARRARLFAILHQQDLSLRARTGLTVGGSASDPALSPAFLAASLADQPEPGW